MLYSKAWQTLEIWECMEILEGIEDHEQFYAWAISQFDSRLKVGKLNIKGKVAVALQGVLASFKLCRKR